MKSVKITLFLSCFLLLVQVSFGQNFKYKAKLEEPENDGFHQIILTPEIQNLLNASYSDLRIYDWKNREVPYLLEKAVPQQTRKYFREYPVIRKEILARKKTDLVLQNAKRTKINNLSLVIKNTNIPKEATLSGSPDGQNWYALDTYSRLQTVSAFDETSEVKMLSFPVSDYEFYKLEINDSASAPLNIIAAGYYDFSAEKGKFTPVPALHFTRTDSLATRQTYLHFKNTHPIRLHNLSFKIDSPDFYLRNATVLLPQERYASRRKKYVELVPFATFQLNSESTNSIELPVLEAREFYLVISNEDNPPLYIKEIKGFQLNAWLIASLKAGKTYELHFGSENTAAPNYDLVNFKNKIPQVLPVIKPQKPDLISKSSDKENEAKSYFKDKSVIWIVLLVVLALLGFMTYQMLKETDKNKNAAN